MQTPGASRRQAQFQPWIFSYTIRAHSSKKWVSRVMIGLRQSNAWRSDRIGNFVMAGHSRSKNGVASLAYVPAIHVFLAARPFDRKMLEFRVGRRDR
jgi:hypothetical protein